MKVKEVLTVLPVALLLGLGVVGTLAPQQAYAATSNLPDNVPSVGRDFWFTFMQNYELKEENKIYFKLHIYAVAESETTVTIKAADGTTLASSVVSAGTVYHYSIDDAVKENFIMTSSGVKESKGLYVHSSDADIALYIAHNFDNNSKCSYDASPVIDVKALGKEYVVQTYMDDKTASELAIVATKDNTTVTIIPNRDAYHDGGSNYPANTPISITLPKAGDTYQLKGVMEVACEVDEYPFNKRFLSGTKIYSNEPIAVFNGGASATVPYNDGADGDHIFEQLIPVQALGKRFIVSEMHGFSDNPKIEATESTEYAVTAIYDGTIVKRNGVPVASLDKGETNYETVCDPGKGVLVAYNEDPVLIETNKPVICYGYTTNGTDNKLNPGKRNVGEPSMVLIPDRRQGVNTAVFTTYDDGFSGSGVHHYVNIVVPDTAVNEMKLDGVSISDQFTKELSNHFEDEAGATWKWRYARVALTSGYHKLSNTKGTFLAYAYGVQWNSARGYAMATSFNVAPSAPIVKIDGKPIEYDQEIGFCDCHPGIPFSAEVDYPHDSIKWDFGDGNKITIPSTESSGTTHEYAVVGSGGTKTHNVRFYVYHHSPILPSTDPNYQRVDSVRLTLKVYPAYYDYDTLNPWQNGLMKVAAKQLSFVWDSSSVHAFGVPANSKIDLTRAFGNPANAQGTNTPDLRGRKAPIEHSWENAMVSKIVTDTLFYKTKMKPEDSDGCDSIFYLKFQVVPDIIKNDPNASVCQKETFTWTGHAAGAGHKVWQKNLTTNVSTKVTASGIITDVDGTFELRDTLESKVYPYPDSIHVCTLTIHTKPVIESIEVRDTCKYASGNTKLTFTTNSAAKRYQYSLDNGANWSAIAAIPDAMPIEISISSLSVGANSLKLKVFSDPEQTPVCESDEASDDFEIFALPVIKVNAIANQCQPAAEDKTITFDGSTTATLLKYKLTRTVSGETTTVIAEGADFADITTDIVLSKTTHMNVPGAYTFTVTAIKSGDGCVVENPANGTQSFTIFPQPVVSVDDIESVCEAAVSDKTVSFGATTTATQLKWQLTRKVGDATTTVREESADFEAITTPITLSASIQINVPGEYTFTVTAIKSGDGCVVNDPENGAKTFKVYPTPVVKVNDVDGICYSNTVTRTVTFDNSTTATHIKWKLERAGNIVSNHTEAYEAIGNINLPHDGVLNQPGVYTFTVTAIKGEGDCEVTTGLTNNTAGFTLSDPATISVGAISDQCEGADIIVPVTDTFADSLIYYVMRGTTEVLRDTLLITGGSGAPRLTNVAIHTGEGAGKRIPGDETNTYKVTVSSNNLNKCGGNTVTSAEFHVYPKPVAPAFTSDSASLSKCVTAYKSANMPVSYTNTTDSIKWQLKRGETTLYTSPGYENCTEKSNTISVPKEHLTVAANNYKLTIISVKSAHGCDKAADVSVNFALYDTAKIELNDITPKCVGEGVTATYTATHVSSYTYKVDTDGGVNKINHSTPVTTVDGTIPDFTTETASLPAGNYILRVTATNKVTDGPSCEGAEQTKTFTINATTELPKLEMAENNTAKCCPAASFTVDYDYVGTPNKVWYKVTFKEGGATKQVWTETDIDAVNKHFVITTDGWDAATYTVEAYVKTAAGCESEHGTDDFTIWPQPLINTLDNATACEGEETVNVHYTSTNAAKYKYSFDGGSSWSDLYDAEPDGYIEINISAWNTGGADTKDFTLTVAAESEHECASATPHKTATITLKKKPLITLDNVTSVCEGSDAIPVTFSALTYTNKFKYEVRKQGSDGVLIYGTKSSQPASGTFDIENCVSDLQWGDYELELIAMGENGCPSVGDGQMKQFKIYQLPTVKIAEDHRKDSVCYNTFPNSKWNVPYTLTGGDADSLYCWLEPDSAAHPKRREVKVTPLPSSIEVPDMNALPYGKYNFMVKAIYRATKCESEIDTVKLVIKQQPKIELTDPSAVLCEEDKILSVDYTYTAVDGGKYTYDLLKVVGTTYTPVAGFHPTTDSVAKATGKINLDIHELEAGDYAVCATATTDLSCSSAADTTAKFTIYPKPIIKDTAAVDTCEGATKTQFSFRVTNLTDYTGTTYTYSADGGAWSTPTTVTSGDLITADLTGIGTWAAGKTYTIKIAVVSGVPCKSDTVTTSFKIKALPSASSVSVNDTCKNEPFVTLKFTDDHAADADSKITRFTYNLERGGVNIFAADEEVTVTAGMKSFQIKADTLPVGDYIVHLTPHSSHPCDGAEVSPAPTFTIHPLPDLSPITFESPLATVNDSVCEGTDTIWAKFTHAGATHYSYVVKQGGTPVRERSDISIPVLGGTETVGISLLESNVATEPQKLDANKPYVLTITVRNNTTTCDVDSTKSFFIHPKLSIEVTDADKKDSICEKTFEGNKWPVAYTLTGKVDSLHYWLQADSTLYPTRREDGIKNPNASSPLEIANMNALPYGKYILVLRAYALHTAVDCESKDDTLHLVIKQQPKIELTDPSAVLCEEDKILSVDYTYTAVDGGNYTYDLLKVEGSTYTSIFHPTTDSVAKATGKINLDIHALEAGDYAVCATATTDLSCSSAADTTVKFTIYPKPIIKDTAAVDTCEGATKTQFSFRVTNLTDYTGTTYTYSADGGAWSTPTTVTSGDLITADLTGIGSWAAGKTYTIKIAVVSGAPSNCKSDTITTSFKIKALPSASSVSVNDTCKNEPFVTLKFTDDYADNEDSKITRFTYNLERGGVNIFAADEEVTVTAGMKSFQIQADTLPVGDYIVHLTPHSSHPCDGAEVSPAPTFTIHPLPDLSPITFESPLATVNDSVCEGTDTIWAKFTHAGATHYSYVVKQGGTTVRSRSYISIDPLGGTETVGISLLESDVAEEQQVLTAGLPYNLTITVRNNTTTCTMDSTKEFYIRKNPVLALTPAEQRICQPVDTVAFHYVNTDATQFEYKVLNEASTEIISGTMNALGAEADSTIRFAAPLLKGEYKLHVTPKDAHCEGLEQIITFHVDSIEPLKTTARLCYGETFTWDTYFDTETNSNRPIVDCNNQSITLAKGLTATTHQLDTIICPGNCDKIYELDLYVAKEYAHDDAPRMIEKGETFTWRGNQLIAEAGTYEYVKAEAVDVFDDGSFYCDSIYRITVKQHEPELQIFTQSVCYGEPVFFNDTWYDNLPVGQQVLLDTLRNTTNFDSVYLRLNLTVGPRYYDSITVTACDSYVWEAVNGNTYTHSGIYREEYATVDGCDSVFVLNLTLTEAYDFYETYDIVTTQLPYTIHDYTFEAGGEYTRQFTSVGGCDSVYHITLNVHELPLPKDTAKVTICDNASPYNWLRQGADYGNFYSTGLYSHAETDSIHYLQLTVNKTYSDTTYVHACGSYTWKGTDYTVSGIYPLAQPSSCGCDSTVVLKLTLGQENTGAETVTACQYEPVVAGNRSFIASANETFTATLRNAAGCDSVVTYTVNVTPRAAATITKTECLPYNWIIGANTHICETEGTYFDTVFDANGCATTITTLELTAKPTYRFDEDVEVAQEALPYIWTGHKDHTGLSDSLLTADGDYYEIWPANAVRCDSVYHIHFHVMFAKRDMVSIQGCDSAFWATTGKWYYADGMVTDTVPFYNSTKDSAIHYCNVAVYHAIRIEEPEFTICENEAFEWHGTTYAARHFPAGDTILSTNDKTTHNCDSVYTAKLHVLAAKVITETPVTECVANLPYEWRGQLLTTDGTYTDSLISISGCDSVYVLDFTVNDENIPDPTVTSQSICQEDTVTNWQMTIPANEPGEYTYYKWYTPAGACDSTYYQLNLTVNPTYHPEDSVAEYHVCEGASYTWFNVARSVTKDEEHKIDDHTYRQIFDDEQKTYLGCDSLKAHLTLYMHIPYDITLEDTIVCNTPLDTFMWDGTKIGTSGEYVKTYEPYVAGCDSTVRRKFTVYNGTYEILPADTVCDTYHWSLDGKDYTESGLLEYKVTTGDICDSTIYLPLTVNKTVKDTVKLTVTCPPFNWGDNGESYSATGIYEGTHHPLPTDCDSISYLNLTVLDSVVTHETVTECDTFTWSVNHLTYTGDAEVRVVESAIAGCDSAIHYLHLTINHSSPDTTFDTIRNVCREFIEGSLHYTKTTDDTVHLTNVTGCDSTVYRHIEIIHPDTIYGTIRTCNQYIRNGETFLYTCDTVQRFDCDSVVLLHITIDYDKPNTDDYVTAWDTYTWEGTTYTIDCPPATPMGEIVETKTLQTWCGCDSIVTLHLTLNSSCDTVETQIACDSFVWNWSGKTYYESIEDTVHLVNGDSYKDNNGVDQVLAADDSTRILKLTIEHPEYTAQADLACEYYIWRGQSYVVPTNTYRLDTTIIDSTSSICKNVDTLYLTLFGKAEVEYFDTVCDLATILGETYDHDTTFTKVLQNAHGCDSTVNFHLKFHYRQTQTLNVTACDSLVWEGTTYTKSGVYTKVLTGYYGCDSVVTLNLKIRPSYHHEFSVTDCSGNYVWDNVIYTQSGDYDSLYTSVSGCDSLVTMHLSLPDKIFGEWLDTTVCDGLYWNGKMRTETGLYEEIFTSAVTGCDSVARLDLKIAPNPRDTIEGEARDRFAWRGETYYESGWYEKRFTRDEGCDSIVTLNLTITNPLPITQIADTACDAYTWDDKTYYESGVYTRNFPTYDENDSIIADSIVKLTLVIMHDTATTDTRLMCDSAMWEGQWYYETGVYTQVLQRTSGCDSVVTMTFTVCHRDSTSFDAIGRDIYIWDDSVYTESGVYTHYYRNATDCDSIVTMTLTMYHSVETSFSDTACSQYVWAGEIYTHSTIHTNVYTAANGCDSVVTMNLIVHEPVYVDTFATVSDCSDPSYTFPWRGLSINRAGTFFDTIRSSVTGCDSIISRLHMTWCDVEPCFFERTDTVSNQCSAYTWRGETFDAGGIYTRQTYDAVSGCDSLFTLRLQMNETAQHFISLTACDTLFWQNDTITESGFYRYTEQTLAGCDSIVTLHAVIGHSGDSTLNIVTCDGYTVNGKTYWESGTYYDTLATVTGCDSVLTINLVVSKSMDTIVESVACDTLVWEGDTITASGFYPMVLQTADSLGCDSVVNLHLIVYESKQTFIIDSLHCDSIVWGDDYAGVDTLYIDSIYTKTFLSAMGCDSTVTMDLRLKRHDLVLAPDTQACDSFVWNSKVYYESGTYSDTVQSTRTGCDSITTRFIRINPTEFSESEDSVPPPYWIWPLNGDTLWHTGDYVETVPATLTGCDSIVTLHLIMTDSIILDSIEPVFVDTFGYCPGDTVDLVYNLLKGHPTRYTLIWEGSSVVQNLDSTRDLISVTDTTDLPNHGMNNSFCLIIPAFCPPGTYCAELQLFDDLSSSEIYNFCLNISVKGVVVSMWTDVVAINNFQEEYIGYQWYSRGFNSADDFGIIPGATKQYYSDGEDLFACYRTKLLLQDSLTWIYTCEECFDLRTDSLELIAYPTPAPEGQPVTIKAMGIYLEKLAGSRLAITNVQGVPLKEYTLEEGQRSVDVELPAGLYIATLVTGTADDVGPRTANVKFTVF